MKKRVINVAATCYIVFAIFCAYTYNHTSATTVASDQDQGSIVVTADGSACLGSQMVRSANTKLVVWSTPNCYGCRTFKRNQVPKLIEAGLYIETIDASTTPPTDTSITAYPTIILYEGEEEIGRWVGDTPAETILAFVPEETEPETPPEYRIWDIRRWWN